MKTLKLIAIALIAYGLGGCNDLLDKEPQAEIATSNAYSTADDASRAVAAAYHPLQAVNWCCQPAGNSNGGGYNYWIFENVAVDDAHKGGGGGSDQVYAQNIAYYSVTPGNLAVNDAWDILYIGVRNANLVLDKVPDIEMDAALKERYLAEAKFLRAYNYFLLVQTFGDVPLILTTELEAYEKERAPASQVLDQVITDLQEAEAVLPTRSEYLDSEIELGRVTKGAAQAYLGKVYMWMEDYPNAMDWFGRVIDSGEYTFDPDYANIFTKAGENGPGTIFSIQYNYDPPNTQNNPMGIVQGSRSQYGWGFNNPTQDFVDAFEPGDPRLEQSVYGTGDIMRDGRVADAGNSPSGYLNRKEYVAEDEAPGGFFNSANDLILMRLGKVMLWYAEAANETDNTQEALEKLNDVRERARQGNPGVLPDVTTTDKAQLRQAIWDEQRVEYGQEYDRRFDLVRTGRIGEVMRNYAEEHNSQKGLNFIDGVHEVMPIPPSEISLSEGRLTQNDGY